MSTLVVAGWVFGGLGLGVPLSLLHVVHSRIASPWDALVVLAWLVILYGGLGALVFVGAGGAIMAVGALAGSPPRPDREVGAGIVVAMTLFVGRYLHMGLTYGEVPFTALHTPLGMVLYVVVRLGLVVLGALLLARVLARPLASPLTHRGLWFATIAVIVGAHLVVPLGLAPASPPGDARGARPHVEGGAAVVFIGLDGADWSVLRPLMEAGELPALAELARIGTTASLDTIRDANSSEIWASIYTGRTSRAHGIQDFVRLELPGMRGPGLYAMYGTFVSNLGGHLAKAGLAHRAAVDRRDLGTMPLWEMALVGGVPIGIVNGFYFTYPPPVIEGGESFVVAYGAAGRADAGAAAYVQPPALAADVAEVLGEPEVAWQRAALGALRARAQPRFVHVYTREPDRTQHRYWKWYQPEYFLGVSDADVERLGDRIPDINRVVDGLVADVLPLVGPETVLIVASDHGHSPTMLHPKLHSHHQHGPPGVLLMAGGAVRAGTELEDAHVYDLAPTVLHLLGLPVPTDADGRVLVHALRPDALARRPVRTVASYEPWQDMVGYASIVDPAHDADEIRRLRALGYVE